MNSADIGRGVALLLAIVLAAVLPLELLILRHDSARGNEVQEALNSFTARTEANRALTLGNYEKLLRELANTGAAYTVEMIIGRKAYIYESSEVSALTTVKADTPIGLSIDAGNAANISKLRMCISGEHIHGRDCYLGHNHEVFGCQSHFHDQSCYCSGKLTYCYKTAYTSSGCYVCSSTGKVTGSATCSSCNGVGQGTKDIKCNCTNGKIMVAETCPNCGGSGKNAKGNSCKKCGGTGKVGVYVTHEYCGGTGIRRNVPWKCSACSGTGVVSKQVDCSYCGGRGSYSSATNYYQCSICGQGSSTAYGQVCGRKICEYENEGYSCGIAQNDNSPLCDRIVVDVNYESAQQLTANEIEDKLNRKLEFTYLDGSKSLCEGVLDEESLPDFSSVSACRIYLKYEGYFLSAANYEVRKFPVDLTLVSSGVICEKCGNTYYPEGENTKCPYCDDGIRGIRIKALKEEYSLGEALSVNVFAVYENYEKQLDEQEYWDTFDSSQPGTQTVLIGFDRFIESFEVRVWDNASEPNVSQAPTPTSTPIPTQIPSSQEREDSEDGLFPTLILFPTTTVDDTYRSDEAILASAYEEILTTEEILELLCTEGSISLNDGDALSVTVYRESSIKGLGGNLFGKKKYTSGIIVRP